MEEKIVKKERNYGVDLLRLISMLMVVVLHVLGQGGILSNSIALTLKGETFWALEILCYGAVNIYAIISGLVGYKTKHKGSSIINLCFQVVFFTIIIAGLDLIMLIKNNTLISIQNIFFNFFPTIKSYWYFSAYFCLFFFMPILDKIIEHTPKSILRTTAFFCFIIFCCWTQLYTHVSNLDNGYSVFWLAILYLVGAYISKYKPFKNFSFLRCILLFFIFIILTIASRIVIGLLTNKILGHPALINVLVSYTSPTITLSSIFLVLAFSKLNFNKKVSKAIAFVAPLSFGVYLIHCNPIIFALMQNSFVWIIQKSILLGLLLVIGVSLSIMIICLFLDYIRTQIFKLLRVNKLSEKIASAISKFTCFIFKVLHIQTREDEHNDIAQ